jgi:hypothetical protein
MKLYGSVRVVRRWRNLRADPIHGCFDDPEGLDDVYLSSGRDPRVHELANYLRLAA